MRERNPSERSLTGLWHETQPCEGQAAQLTLPGWQGAEQQAWRWQWDCAMVELW